MRNKIFYALVLSFAGAYVQAQSLDRQVIGSAGAYQAASWGSLSATTGESITNTFTASSIVLTQGFQQPMQEDLMVYELPSNNMTVRVFPNPASDVINVVINTNNPNKHYYVTLLDIAGQALKIPCQDMSSGTETKFMFYLGSLADAAYLVQISDERNVQVKTIKFSKIN